MASVCTLRGCSPSRSSRRRTRLCSGQSSCRPAWSSAARSRASARSSASGAWESSSSPARSVSICADSRSATVPASTARARSRCWTRSGPASTAARVRRAPAMAYGEPVWRASSTWRAGQLRGGLGVAVAQAVPARRRPARAARRRPRRARAGRPCTKCATAASASPRAAVSSPLAWCANAAARPEPSSSGVRSSPTVIAVARSPRASRHSTRAAEERGQLDVRQRLARTRSVGGVQGEQLLETLAQGSGTDLLDGARERRDPGHGFRLGSQSPDA